MLWRFELARARSIVELIDVYHLKLLTLVGVVAANPYSSSLFPRQYIEMESEFSMEVRLQISTPRKIV